MLRDATGRFVLGANYAWARYGQDFGGVAAWNSPGVSGSAHACLADLEEMRAHGVEVVRWWLFPEFWGEGVIFDASGMPVGLGGTASADVATALDLAARADVGIMFCLFSFDGFRPTRDVGAAPRPVRSTSLQPVVIDEDKRGALIESVVRPLARAISAHPHADRVVAWDVINEPEWAMTGSNPYGDAPYDPQLSLQPVTHAQMERFVADVIRGLRAETEAPISVGSSGLKWARAWTGVDVDFYQVHLFDWVNALCPYDRPAASYGLTDKPVVVGEFPFAGLQGVSCATLLNTFLDIGYAGALGWAFNEKDNAWATARHTVKAFAGARRV